MLSYAPLIIFLILLWIRPEYMFLLFYVVANTALSVVFTIWYVPFEQMPIYAATVALNDVLLLVLGALVIALRKWLNTRETGSDKELDSEIERIRSEIAARDRQS